MAFHAEAMSEQKRNPISTLDDAVMWLGTVDGDVAYRTCDEDRIFVFVKVGDEELGREITPSHDARGTLMMATRELWEMVNK